MSNPDHIILYTLLFLLYMVWGRYNHKTENSMWFWIEALLPILAFSLVTGLRYGWGNDYMWYKFQFENAFSNNSEILDTQFAWRKLNQIMNYIGFNYVGAFITYSFVFIVSAFLLIKSFGKESQYMYGFLVPALLFSVTFTIRQGFSNSFIFLAIFFLNKRKWICVALSVLCVGLFHLGNLAVVMIIALFRLLANKKPINWKITIPLVLFFTYVFDVAIISSFSTTISNFSLGSSYLSNYLENSNEWFSENAINTDAFERGVFSNAVWTLFYLSFIFLGYKALKFKPNRNIIYLYNTVIFGVIFYQAIRWFEIWRRFAEPLISFYFIVLGYSIFVISKKYVLCNNTALGKIKRELYVINPVLFKLIISMILLCLVLFWGRFILFSPNAQFVWN